MELVEALRELLRNKQAVVLWRVPAGYLLATATEKPHRVGDYWQVRATDGVWAPWLESLFALAITRQRFHGQRLVDKLQALHDHMVEDSIDGRKRL